MELCEKSLLLTGAILPEPTLCKASCPHHLGGLLMFCSQLVKRHVRYITHGLGKIYGFRHIILPSPSPGSPKQGCFGGRGRVGSHPQGPQEAPGDAPRGTASGRGAGEGFIFSSIFSPHSAAIRTARPPGEEQPPEGRGDPAAG